MDTAKYYILIGALLLAMAISPGLLRRLPFTPAIVYFLFGVGLGRHGLNVHSLDPLESSKLIEVVSEITVIVSLFTIGLKLRVPFRDTRWRLPLSYATVSMALTAFVIALFGYGLLGLPLGAAVLLGGILSPTDPVLASEVQLHDPEDRDRIRFLLTTEGGLNDGTAFPFVMLGLGLAGTRGADWTLFRWLWRDLLWAVAAGIAVGAACGAIISRTALYVREIRRSFYLEDFLTMGSIALSYGLALQLHAYGFLAVLANALTIRHLELRTTGLGSTEVRRELPDDVLSFNEQLERFFEVVSVGLVGLLVDLKTLTSGAVLLALFVFLVARPLAIFAGSATAGLPRADRLFVSWMGVRGIGSIYYLYFALNHAPALGARGELVHLTLWVIVFSIFLHGSSVKLILRWKKGR